jgi:plastocyanin
VRGFLLPEVQQLDPRLGRATTSQSGEVNVSIIKITFDPATLTKSIDTNVTWTNNDSVSHTAISDDYARGSNSLLKVITSQ